jgi:D-alanine-D-alanine ligase
VLLERFVDGVEVTVGVLDGRAMGTVEIRPRQGFYDYDAKYQRDDTQYVVPAELGGDRQAVARVRSWAEQVHGLLGCAGATRVDFMVDRAGDSWFIELNTLPGMTDHSLLPMAATEMGMDFGDLCEAVLDRATLHHRAVGDQQ